ncbi:YqgE/AlgH family protein [Halovulum dunhuangense]|uniref:UPF0301 protein HMH01_04445 n=1 Tax=Halovulum dunhuangense TaxID=1505036 RepID=A0A849KWN4_9RHOB|nr:YqgE/AlgH family protein [Halovulum dunhuangense]NNU79685.1 YqgE/AlgH family protein [Halovulum dunhuangense]
MIKPGEDTPSADAEFLEGKLLVAMPGMGDPRFDRSVIFMCAHSSEGAMGLMINKRAEELTFRELLDQLDIPVAHPVQTPTVYFGGPVEHGRGFVLHSADYSTTGSTMSVRNSFGVTATLSILRDIAEGRGPRAALLTLGYAGWAPGQLEQEIQANGWLTCDADEAIVFDTAPEKRWAAALSRIGIDPRLLSAEGGRA